MVTNSPATTLASTSESIINEKITALYKLQKIDSQIDAINHIKGELPLEVKDLEDVVEGIEKRIQTLLQQIEELSVDTKAKKELIETSKALIAKYEEQQRDVRNNREYEAIGKEIEFQHLEIELAEKNIKEFSADSKSKKKIIEEVKEELEGRKIDLNDKRAELESIESETSDQIVALEKEKAEVSKLIDYRLLDAYRRIRTNVRNGLAVVEVRRNACGGCFNHIPPQRQLDIRQNKKVIVCEYCGRILVSDLFAEQEQ